MRAFKDTCFETSDRPVKIRLCEHPNCGQPGDYRAPRSREQLNSYFHFCLTHVRAYNRAWDYFAGLTQDQVEAYTRDATVWERPSWPLGQWGITERQLRDKAMRDIFGDAPQPDAAVKSPPLPIAEREALATLELTPPVTFVAIKAHYRALVKQHHPDLHNGNPDSEEKFKMINQAFAVLRQAYGAVT